MKRIFFLLLLSLFFYDCLGQTTNSKWEYSIECQYKNLEPFVGGVARAKNSKNFWGFINQYGEWIIKPKFANCTNFSNAGIAKVSIKKNNKTLYGFINKSGEYVIKPLFLSLTTFKHGLSIAQAQSELYGVIGVSGKWIITPKYDRLTRFQYELSKATYRNKVGFIDIKGEWVIPPIFEAGKFQNRYTILVKEDGKWGVIKINKL
ncbi:MAG: WG repeat-containing protein [Bacteroidetes bacterium]|nr:WG repeat-containing protein [Bacteroidota bacterium]